MLEANKSARFEQIFAVYNRSLLKRRFRALRFSGSEILSKGASRVPKLIYVNHSSWWDGLVAFQISSTLKMDSFLMMEEKQLERLFLFRKLGAFSVIREKPFEAMKSINYAADLLKENSQRTLWIFPQGEILPNDIRPVKFYGGVSRIIKKIGQCAVFPLALRYEFLGEFKPVIFAKAGNSQFIDAAKKFNIKCATKSFEEKIVSLLEEIKNDILTKNFDGYKNII